MKIETITRTYVDLSLFVIVFEHINPNCHLKINTKYLTFTWSHYTMNPHGFHVGYEDYLVTLDLVEARDCENTPRNAHPFRKMLVDIESIDNLTCESAPETEPCACESGDCLCGDEEHVCNEESGCCCERYISPIDDGDYLNDEWVYEEFRHMIEMVTNYPARWEFDNGQWYIKNNEGMILYQSDWKPGI